MIAFFVGNSEKKPSFASGQLGGRPHPKYTVSDLSVMESLFTNQDFGLGIRQENVALVPEDDIFAGNNKAKEIRSQMVFWCLVDTFLLVGTGLIHKLYNHT